MKILDLKTFLTLPQGTIFMKYSPCYFEGLCSKGESLPPRDFAYCDITTDVDCNNSNEVVNMLDESERDGTSIPLAFNRHMRDGCFEDTQLFAVYEKKDIEGLISKLQNCIEITNVQKD